MKLKTCIGICGTALSCVAFADGDTSAPTLVFLQPEQSSFWHTATGQTMTLPIVFPEGASSAELAVRGTNYDKLYADITTDAFELTLPVAADPSAEDVYELTLTFDNGDTRTARLGMIAGLADSAEGATRCLTDTASRKWTRAFPHSMVFVPYGTTAFSVNAQPVEVGDKGFTGAQGWYAIQDLRTGDAADCSMTVDGETYDASLVVRDRCGLSVILR